MSAKNLTREQVLEIYQSELSVLELMGLYEKSRRTITRIKQGQSWKSVTGGTDVFVPNYNSNGFSKIWCDPELSAQVRKSQSDAAKARWARNRGDA